MNNMTSKTLAKALVDALGENETYILLCDAIASELEGFDISRLIRQVVPETLVAAIDTETKRLMKLEPFSTQLSEATKAGLAKGLKKAPREVERVVAESLHLALTGP